MRILPRSFVVAASLSATIFTLFLIGQASALEVPQSPIAFTKNMGQWPDSILFRSSARGATMWFTKTGIWYQFSRTVEKFMASSTTLDSTESFMPDGLSHDRDSIEATMIKAEYVGTNELVEVIGLEEQEYKCNYFIGSDPSNWQTDA